MKRVIYAATIPAFLLMFFWYSCNQGGDKEIAKGFTIHEQKFIKEGRKTPDTILLVSMSFGETNLIEPISKKITAFYSIPVKQIKSHLPASAFYILRNRYRADSLLNYLAALNNGRYRFVVGLTSKDISCTMNNIQDWGVFGLGNLSGKGCVTSSFRLKKNVSLTLLTERLQKVVLHEIGHNHGLGHCKSTYPCFMKAAEGKISVVDNEPMEMCKMCRQKAKL